MKKIYNKIEKEILRRTRNMIVSLDQFLCTWLSFGNRMPDETISSAAYVLHQKDKIAGKILMPTIDFMFRPWMKNHCYLAFKGEAKRKDLPKEYRL